MMMLLLTFSIEQDATAGMGTHNCHCPPGMVGDGVTRCDVYSYFTIFSIGVNGVDPAWFDKESALDRLYEIGVIPSSISRTGRVEAEVFAYSPEMTINTTEPVVGLRRSSSTGSLLVVTITSYTKQSMDDVTPSIETSAIAAAEPGWVVIDVPHSSIETIDTAFAPINTVLAGFSVDSVAFSDADYKWVVTSRYISDIPNTITGIYISKVGPAPYSEIVRNSFYVSQHPCIKSSSVCCLNSFKNMYTVGSFSGNITEAIGECGEVVANQVLPIIFFVVVIIRNLIAADHCSVSATNKNDAGNPRNVRPRRRLPIRGRAFLGLPEFASSEAGP